MKKILILSLLAGVAFGQGYAVGGIGGIGTGTNGQLAIWTGVDSIGASGVTAYDPNILIAMIGTNSTAIDNRYGTNSVVVTTTSDPLENGTNLVSVINSFCSVSNAGTAVLVEGFTCTLPEDIAISNCAVKIVAVRSAPCLPVFATSTTIESAPQPRPVASITGNITFAQSTAVLGSLIDGVKITGNISGVRNGDTDKANPIVIQNSWIVGNVASNEATSIHMNGCLLDGSYAEAGSYDCDMNLTAVVGDNSFGLPVGALSTIKSFNRCWFLGDRYFGSKTRAGTPIFTDCTLSGKDYFYPNTTSNAVEVYNSRFVLTASSTNAWLGLSDAGATKIYNSTGLHTNLQSYGSAYILNSYDWLYNSVTSP